MQSSEASERNLQQEEGQRSQEEEAWVRVDMRLSTSEELVGETTQSQSLIRGYTLEQHSQCEVGNTTDSQNHVGGNTLEESDENNPALRPSRDESITPPRSEVSTEAKSGETDKSTIALLADIVKSNSPATSTPGSTPSSKGSKEDLFGDSGKNVEMSAINLDEEDDIEVIKENEEVEPMLDGNSMEVSYNQSASDSGWKSLNEGETTNPQSCVAKRTRSKTEGIRKKQISLFLNEEEDSAIDEAFNSINAKDSFTLGCTNKDQWISNMKELDETVEYVQEAVDIGNKTLEILEGIKKESVIVPEEGGEIIEIEREGENKASRKKVTFYIEKANCSNAVERLNRVLENITEINSDTLPRKYLEGIIKYLSTICIDSYEQMQTSQRLIGALSEVLEEMLENEENSHELRRENRRQRKSIEELKDSVEQWKRMYNAMLDCVRPDNR